MTYLYHLIYFIQHLQAGGKTLEGSSVYFAQRGSGVEVSSDRPWEEGSNGHHVAASRGGFPETRHHHPGSLRKLFPEPCSPQELLRPEPPRTPRSSANLQPHSWLHGPGIWAHPSCSVVLASVHFAHQLFLCVSVIAGLQKHVVHIMLTQLQLQSVASFGEETLKFSKAVLRLCL